MICTRGPCIARTTGGMLKMNIQQNLGKFTGLGTTATTAPGFFQSCHETLHHSRRDLHCSCTLRNGPLSEENGKKLESLKEKFARNAFFDKYKEKFKQMEESSPRELLAKLEQLDKKDAESKLRMAKELGALKRKAEQNFVLQDVMDVERIKDLERDDIMFLWQEFHRKKDGVLGAVMSGSVFDKMTDLAGLHPMFLLPLPRPTGYEFLFVQYMGKAFHFTPLIAYQSHKENAPECLRLVNYTDLQASKDLVLLRGEFDTKLLGEKEAHILAVQINFYYGETSESRRQLLETFTARPDSFNHMDLIEEFNRLQESHRHLFEFEG